MKRHPLIFAFSTRLQASDKLRITLVQMRKDTLSRSISLYNNQIGLPQLLELDCRTQQVGLEVLSAMNIQNVVLSDEFELVSDRPMRLSFIPRQVRATRQERQCVSA